MISILIPAIFAIVIFAASSAKGAGGPAADLGAPPAYVVALILAIILFMGTLLSGVMTLYGVVKEKQNRVAELLLSSASAREMMAGKVIGLGFAGLIQVTVWIALAYFVAGRFTPISLSSLGPVHWTTYPIYFILGYLLVASIFAALGAVMKDVQSGGASGIVGIIPCIPIWLAAFIIEHPNHLLVRIMSFIPPFTPATMMLRLGVTPVAWWEIGLSIICLGLGVWLAMRFAARVFEIGLLMYGKTPSLKELWTWARTRRAS